MENWRGSCLGWKFRFRLVQKWTKHVRRITTLGSAMQLVLTDDGSIVRRDDGAILHFSPSRFRTEIVEGDCCFLCGAPRHRVEFNDEHVVPDWILREFSLHNKRIVLPNGQHVTYSMYKVPCCVECNRFLGSHVEEPISEILRGGYAEVANYMMEGAPWLLFKWLALIFLKTHLKDTTLRYSLDLRRTTIPIGSLYDWEAMHHIHCLVRTLRTGLTIDVRAIGSMFLFPVKQADHFEGFDYGDLQGPKALFVCFRDTAVVCVLNDACGCVSLMGDGQLAEIAGPLSPLQLREVFVRIAYINTLITTRPKFFTTGGEGMPEIGVQLPEYFESDQGDDEEYGAMMLQACSHLVENCFGDEGRKIIKKIATGRWTFLFDSEGSFVANSMDLLQREET